jgi:hypothetical protein
MKIAAAAFALLVLGFGSSYALAKGKPPKGGTGSTTSSTTTGTTTAETGSTTTSSSHGKGRPKLSVCHKAGKSGRWVKITVADKAAQKHLLKHGDVLPDAQGNCPAPAPKHTTTGAATTTVTTTAK